MKKYSMTSNFLKSSQFHRCSANLSPSKKKEKVNILIFVIWNSHGRSDPEIISVRRHTSLRVFTALGQFREMVKSPQTMGLNKQKSLYSYYTFKLVSFKPRILPVLGHLGIWAFRPLGHFEGLWIQISQNKGRNTQGVVINLLHFKSNEFQIKCKGDLRVQFRPRVTGALDTRIKYLKKWTGIDKK